MANLGPTSVRTTTDDIPIFKEGSGSKQFWIGKGQAIPSGFGSSVFANTPAAPTGGSGGPPVNNAIGEGGTSPLVATSGSFIDNFGNALSEFGETDAQKQERIELTRAEFDKEKERIQETGAALESVRKGRASKGGQAGVGIETLTDNEIRLIKKDTEKAIESNTIAMRQAIASGNTAASDKARKNLELAFNMQLDIENQALKKSQAELNAISTEFDITSQIPAGQTVTIQGVEFTGIDSGETDPFFSGGDIISAMKALGPGETTSITDPNTNLTFELQGFEGDPDTFKVTGDDGTVTIMNTNGDIIGQSEAGVGKSKTGPSMVSVQFPKQSRNPIFDAQGNQIGFQNFNPITGNVENLDFDNNPIDFPVGGRIGSVSSDFGGDGEDII